MQYTPQARITPKARLLTDKQVGEILRREFDGDIKVLAPKGAENAGVAILLQDFAQSAGLKKLATNLKNGTGLTSTMQSVVPG